jgi:perosamine synthetase
LTDDQQRYLPVALPDLSGKERDYVLEAVDSTWISSTGKFVDRFENEFAQACGTKHALTCSNGTVALHLALLTLDAGAGDEVIIPSLTFISTANAVRYVGATPVFADVDPATWCLDPEKIEAGITDKTKGIIVVHLYGHPADMDRIKEIAERRGLWIIEDAAEAHFARYKGQTVGGIGDIGTFSFYGNKTVTSGEGGAITFNRDDLLEKARMLRGQGMDPERRYYFPIIGHNFRLTNIACALLCAQLERWPEILEWRKKLFATYRKYLEDIPGIDFQPVAEWAEPTPWLFCITVDEEVFGCSRDELMAQLDAAGIETRPFFIPIHTLPPYISRSETNVGFPETTILGRSGINLPTHKVVDEQAASYISDQLRKFQR